MYESHRAPMYFQQLPVQVGRIPNGDQIPVLNFEGKNHPCEATNRGNSGPLGRVCDRCGQNVHVY